MIKGVLTIATFISVLFFPWPLTAFLAFVASVYVPLVPLAVGIFSDTIYFSPQANFLPIFTIFGAIVTSVIIFVRSRLSTGII